MQNPDYTTLFTAVFLLPQLNNGKKCAITALKHGNLIVLPCFNVVSQNTTINLELIPDINVVEQYHFKNTCNTTLEITVLIPEKISKKYWVMEEKGNRH